MGNQKGLSLVEVVIAVAVLAIIATGIITAMHVSLKTTAIANERTTAESLTRTALEVIKNCAYYDENCPDYDESVSPTQYYQDDVDENVTHPDNRYDIVVAAVPIDPDTYLPLPSGDLGIQEVKVGVSYEDELVVTTESYKVKR